ncbi:hypothetical protein BB559_000769 [Furculomyces boomerangus]|uniref:Uncharacterized protein n=2 Tax=Harpellales TaxID=61421 RepID=A0A2T9Z468_9FUNG|nr:hypothetical protein BB559_000769 [Furculomyces boomerangus]PVZ98764.1 hypothetical protein BB558_005233 [Smittium angustum]PWA03229.1 hypothetical protein BB558_000565 [Smittium angustum]
MNGLSRLLRKNSDKKSSRKSDKKSPNVPISGVKPILKSYNTDLVDSTILAHSSQINLNSTNNLENPDFSECYKVLRKSYSTENLNTTNSELSIQSKTSNESSLKSFKKFFNFSRPSKLKQRDSLSFKTSDSSKKNPIKNIFSHKSSIKSNSSLTDDLATEYFSHSNNTDSQDIDEPTALNTLYNLLNQLIELNTQNRSKAEELVLRFNILQESFNELEDKIVNGIIVYPGINVSDQADEKTLKENTDGMSLMLLDDKSIDINSSIGDVFKMIHGAESSITDQESRCKSVSLLASEYSGTQQYTHKPPTIIGYIKTNSVSESQITTIDSESINIEKNEEGQTKKNLNSQFKVSTMSLPKYILLNNQKNLSNDKLTDISHMELQRK